MMAPGNIQATGRVVEMQVSGLVKRPGAYFQNKPK